MEAKFLVVAVASHQVAREVPPMALPPLEVVAAVAAVEPSLSAALPNVQEVDVVAVVVAVAAAASAVAETSHCVALVVAAEVASLRLLMTDCR